ncbi:MAG: tetratricopeptide repeat protein, partial [Gemmatimonadaceae bacterium]
MLFDSGRKLMEAGQYEAAIPKMRDSYRMDPAAGTLLNLAECYARTGRTASAWSTYRDASAVAASSGEKDRERFATEHAAALKPTLSTITIIVPPESRVTGLSVTVNGGIVPEALWGQPFPVDPGRAEVNATAPAHVPWKGAAEVGKQSDTVTLSLGPLRELPAPAPAAVVPAKAPAQVAPIAAPAPALPPDETSENAPDGTQSLLGYILGGAGIVGLGVSAGLYARAEGTIRDSNCPANRCVVGQGNYTLHE